MMDEETKKHCDSQEEQSIEEIEKKIKNDLRGEDAFGQDPLRPIPAFKPATKVLIDAPDLEYKGNISYTIRWKGDQVELIVNEDSFKVKAVVFAEAADHMRRLEAESKNNKKKYTAHERQSIGSSRWLLDRIAESFITHAKEEITKK